MFIDKGLTCRGISQSSIRGEHRGTDIHIFGGRPGLITVSAPSKLKQFRNVARNSASLLCQKHIRINTGERAGVDCRNCFSGEQSHGYSNAKWPPNTHSFPNVQLCTAFAQFGGRAADTL